LKAAVDEVFAVPVSVIPFSIADQFFNPIQMIGNCVRQILARRMWTTKVPEMCFDQILVVTLFAVLASGLSDLPLIMAYSFRFSEVVRATAQRQCAMSHREGLCTDLERLDHGDVRREDDPAAS
jgi:hypothetical protein